MLLPESTNRKTELQSENSCEPGSPNKMSRLHSRTAGDGAFWLPDFLVASADDLIDGQYADRPQLRPIFDTIIKVAESFGDVTIQTRKTYVSLVTSRRTFARIKPTTKSRVDLALRLEGHNPGGRLQVSKIHETTNLQISLASADEIDTEVLNWLKEAYNQNT